jgi:pantoate--beta-alanine ligase
MTSQSLGTARPPTVAMTRTELEAARSALPSRDVAAVMTMGALHEGHAQLIRTARARHEHVIVTIFLNPLQFGPKEDLSRYPRTFDDDMAICTEAGVDVVFAPTPDVVYPDGDPGVRVSATSPVPAAPTSGRRTPSSSCSSGGWSGTSTSPSRSSRSPRSARTTGWR